MSIGMNIIVRQAKPEDMDDILRLGRDFFYSGGLGRFFEFCSESTVEFIEKSFVPENTFGVFVSEDEQITGIAGVFLVPHFFNKNVLVAQEIFWWVDPPHRGSRAGIKLYRAMMDYMIFNDADVSSMADLESLESLDAFYTKLGYVRTDHNYMKRI